ncbi:MAG TPA: sugar transferase [Gemmatimonadaceae bacterium]|nr:sugar transferase [Gemmatimonadaceae bacterium]
MKRLLDVAVSAIALVILSPILAATALLIYLQDRHSPLYVAVRTARANRSFRMIKFRSMVVRADATGVDSTAGDDPRITRLGALIRRFKLDELPQLANVLAGDMSLVGPRPNVPRETDLYTPEEKRLLSIRPGITDLASIVFADEAEILRGSSDPDLLYNQIIRPWKSRLGLLYVEHAGSVTLDLRIIALTAATVVNRPGALQRVAELVRELGGEPGLVQVAARTAPLRAAPPPGAAAIVQSREMAASAPARSRVEAML